MVSPDELAIAWIKEHQAEIQREFERYHMMRAGHAARPSRSRLTALLQRVRHWTREAETQPRLHSACADPGERWSS